jgi:catechol 2,3-dioxygenase-like lactoylglutathione lyase family enzyme
MAEIDHLVLAVRDLDEGVRYVEGLTGVRAVPGGPHPGIGTRNALLSFDELTYFEIIAVDPGQPEPARPRPFGIDGASSPRLAGFAVHPSPGETFEQVAGSMRACGLDPGPVTAMSRTRPDGEPLHWRMTRPLDPSPPTQGLAPFVIDWGGTTSPAASAPSIGALMALRISHPDPAVRASLDALALGLEVSAGPAALEAEVDSRRGRVVLS